MASEIRPFAQEWEDAKEFPRSLFKRMGELGLLGLKFPARYGGQGGDSVADAVLVEELGRCGSAGVAAGIGAHIGIALPPILAFGDERQCERWLKPGIAGTKTAALAVTEPDTGSDVSAIKTFARREGDIYVVNGSKTFITNGVRADIVVTAVRTRADAGHGSLSFLVLERGMPGFTVSRKLEKLGWHASDTAELSFVDVEVPIENRLGEENRGFYLIVENFQWERLLMALSSVGGMDAAFKSALDYSKRRRAFGRPIGSLQAIRHKLAWMAGEIEAARSLTYNALRLFASGGECMREVTMAKLYATEAAVRVSDEAVQIFGGMGYMRECGAERALRDARLGPIGGGTSEIMKEIIGRGYGL